MVVAITFFHAVRSSSPVYRKYRILE